MDGLWDEGRRAWTRLLGWVSAPAGGALAVLSDVSLLRGLLAQAETTAVKAARREGRSWSEIAATVGMSRQSAWERWRDLDAPAADPLGAAAGDLASALLEGPSEVRVPDVVGATWRRAQQQLAAAGLVATVVDPVDGPTGSADDWQVVEQKPAAGGLRPRGGSVSLWLGRGPGSAGVREPRRTPPDPLAARGARDDEAERATEDVIAEW